MKKVGVRSAVVEAPAGERRAKPPFPMQPVAKRAMRAKRLGTGSDVLRRSARIAHVWLRGKRRGPKPYDESAHGLFCNWPIIYGFPVRPMELLIDLLIGEFAKHHFEVASRIAYGLGNLYVLRA